MASGIKLGIIYSIYTLAFGGNPDQITLAGQDAGGVMSLTSLMINQDLNIKSVILQSAGLQHPWSYIESREAFRRTLNLADLVGKKILNYFLMPLNPASIKKRVMEAKVMRILCWFLLQIIISLLFHHSLSI